MIDTRVGTTNPNIGLLEAESESVTATDRQLIWYWYQNSSDWLLTWKLQTMTIKYIFKKPSYLRFPLLFYRWNTDDSSVQGSSFPSDFMNMSMYVCMCNIYYKNIYEVKKRKEKTKSKVQKERMKSNRSNFQFCLQQW